MQFWYCIWNVISWKQRSMWHCIFNSHFRVMCHTSRIKLTDNSNNTYYHSNYPFTTSILGNDNPNQWHILRENTYFVYSNTWKLNDTCSKLYELRFYKYSCDNFFWSKGSRSAANTTPRSVEHNTSEHVRWYSPTTVKPTLTNKFIFYDE